MNAKEFYIELGNIDDELISEAGETPARRKKPVFIYTAIASAACLCLLIGGIALGISSGNNTPVVSGEDTQQSVTEGPTFKKTGDTSENNVPAEHSNSVYIISVSPDATEEKISALLNNEGLTVVYSCTERLFAVSVPALLNETEEAEFIKRLESYEFVLSVEPDPALTADLDSE